MTDKHCESVNECANGELCAMLKNSVGLTLVGCSRFKPKQPMTNFQRITQTEEKLAEFMAIIDKSDDKYKEKSKQGWLNWLKQESE